MAMNEYDLKKIESYWIDIERLKKDLRYREWELLNPHQEQDTNIGGGRGGNISDTTFQKATTLLEDRQYQNLKATIEVIGKVYANCDEEEKKIIEMRYWDKKEAFTWEEIADELYMSRSKVLSKRNYIIDKTAEGLGWI